MTAVNRMIVKIISLIVLAVCITVFLASMALARRDASIYPSNTAVGGMSIANLNHPEAQQKLQSEKANRWGNNLQLKINNNSNSIIKIPLSELHIYCNVDSSLDRLEHKINQPSHGAAVVYHAVIRGAAINTPPVFEIKEKSCLYNKLAELKSNLDRPAVNARVLYTKGNLEYVEHKNGMTIDLDASFKRIQNRLEEGSLGPIPLVTKTLYPEVRIEDIKSITDLIGVSDMNMQNGINRNELTLIMNVFNGTVIMPGDEFSWQTAVSEKCSLSDQQNLIEVNELLSNACSSASLNILNTEPGKLTFANNLGKPIMITLAEDGNDLEAKIFGCQIKKGKEISMIKEQTILSPEIEVQEDSNLKPGERNIVNGQAGKIIRTYRIVKVNGVKTEKKLLSEEVYPARNTIMKVPPDTIIK